MMKVKMDIHTHTTYSDGLGSIIENVTKAEEKNIETIAITDHGPSHIYGLTPAQFRKQAVEINTVREGRDIVILMGAEADLAIDTNITDIGNRGFPKLDFVLGGLHTFPGGKHSAETIIDRWCQGIIKIIEGEMINVLAHPTAILHSLGIYPTVSQLGGVVEVAADHNVAFEINPRYKVPDLDIVQMCLREGVKLAVGSDAHRPTEVGELRWIMKLLEKAKVERGDLFIP